MNRRERPSGELDGRVVAILAGGRATRLGGAKATADLGGRPLISYPLTAARDAGLEAFVAAKPETRLPPIDCRVVRDEPEGSHPIAGLLAALGTVGQGGILAIGCDMPFVPPALLAWLARLDASLAVPVVGGRLQPLLARYPVAAASPLRRALQRGDALRDAVESLDPVVLPETELARFGDPRRIVFNVNSPEDLAAASGTLREDAALEAAR